MKVKHAQQVIGTITSGVLAPGALWISGYLDEAGEAERTLRRHAARKRREAERKLAAAPPAKKLRSKPKRSR
jgi:hypothetical protein